MASKIIGVTLRARSGGFLKFKALAEGFGMNTHGTLEDILSAFALQEGFIGIDVFVDILTMAILTIISGAPLMRWGLKRDKVLLPKEI